MSKKKPNAGHDPNSVVPFIVSGLFFLVGGLSFSYLLTRNRLPEQGNDPASIILGISIVISGVLFITAWAKRQ